MINIQSSHFLFFYFLDDFEMYVWGKNQKGCLGIYVAQQLDQSYPFRVIATIQLFLLRKRELRVCDNCHFAISLRGKQAGKELSLYH